MTTLAQPAVYACANCHSRVHDYATITWWWLLPVSLPMLVIALHDRNILFLIVGLILILGSVIALLAWQSSVNRCAHCGSHDLVPLAQPPA